MSMMAGVDTLESFNTHAVKHAVLARCFCVGDSPATPASLHMHVRGTLVSQIYFLMTPFMSPRDSKCTLI